MMALRLIRVLDLLYQYACALEPARALVLAPVAPARFATR